MQLVGCVPDAPSDLRDKRFENNILNHFPILPIKDTLNIEETEPSMNWLESRFRELKQHGCRVAISLKHQTYVFIDSCAMIGDFIISNHHFFLSLI